MDIVHVLWQNPLVTQTQREEKKAMALRRLGLGWTIGQACQATRISRDTFERWRRSSSEFKEAFAAVWTASEEVRRYRLWLRHPFRGKRPPTGKGNGGKPRFSYGRR